MIRPTRINIALVLISFLWLTAACTVSKHGCKVSINKKKLSYYNGLQYRGARKN
jgi:hypothetical protein